MEKELRKLFVKRSKAILEMTCQSDCPAATNELELARDVSCEQCKSYFRLPRRTLCCPCVYYRNVLGYDRRTTTTHMLKIIKEREEVKPK